MITLYLSIYARKHTISYCIQYNNVGSTDCPVLCVIVATVSVPLGFGIILQNLEDEKNITQTKY